MTEPYVWHHCENCADEKCKAKLRPDIRTAILSCSDWQPIILAVK